MTTIDIDSDGWDPTNDSILHIACDGDTASPVRMLGGPEPNDPDRYGNIRESFRCIACDAKGSVLFSRHGGDSYSLGFAPREELDASH